MIYFLITIISVLIGFYLGTKVNFELIEEDGKKIVRKVQEIIPKSDLTPGIVKRPSAQELFKKNEDPIKKAGDKAMNETLSKIPELEEARKQFEEAKAKNLI